jgi:hypothetical protein
MNADGDLITENKDEAKSVGDEVWSRRKVGQEEMKSQIGAFLIEE